MDIPKNFFGPLNWAKANMEEELEILLQDRIVVVDLEEALSRIVKGIETILAEDGHNPERIAAFLLQVIAWNRREVPFEEFPQP